MRQLRRDENRKAPTTVSKRSANRRETAAGYAFLQPVAARIHRPHRRPDDLLALPRPSPTTTCSTAPEWIGLGQLRTDVHGGPERFLQSVEMTLGYVLFGTPLKLAAALARGDAAEHRSTAARASSAPRSTPRRSSAPRSRSRSCGRRCSAIDGPVDQSPELLRHRPGRLGGQRAADHADVDPADGLAVRCPDGDLPRRA